MVLKPSKRATLNRLQVAILALLPSIRRPTGVALNWLEPSTDKTSGAKYIDLMRRVYTLVNYSSALLGLSSNLVTTLFVNAGADALQFLAGIWLQARSNSESGPAQYSALKHAAAFLEAHYSTQRFVDFQTIVPAVLVAVQCSDRRLREAALECVSGLVHLAQAKSPSAVYAFDALYGAGSGTSHETDHHARRLTFVHSRLAIPRLGRL